MCGINQSLYIYVLNRRYIITFYPPILSSIKTTILTFRLDFGAILSFLLYTITLCTSAIPCTFIKSVHGHWNTHYFLPTIAPASLKKFLIECLLLPDFTENFPLSLNLDNSRCRRSHHGCFCTTVPVNLPCIGYLAHCSDLTAFHVYQCLRNTLPSGYTYGKS